MKREILTDISNRQIIARPTSSLLQLDHYIRDVQLVFVGGVEVWDVEGHTTELGAEGFGVYAVVGEGEGFD